MEDNIKPAIYCFECERPIGFSEKAIKRAKSSKVGVYYDGPPICQKCCDIMKEEAIAISEASHFVTQNK